MQRQSNQKYPCQRSEKNLIERFPPYIFEIDQSYKNFDMKMRYVLAFLLLVSTFCHLTQEEDHTPENAIPSEVFQSLRENANKVISNLKNFGNGAASLGLIKFELNSINKCLDQILSYHNKQKSQSEASTASGEMLVIANKELASLTENSDVMDLDFLIVASPLSLIREIILGTYKIKLSNIDAITNNPDDVITKMSEGDAFSAAKNLFLYTPESNRILC